MSGWPDGPNLWSSYVRYADWNALVSEFYLKGIPLFALNHSANVSIGSISYGNSAFVSARGDYRRLFTFGARWNWDLYPIPLEATIPLGG
jgi:hypothetical protein